MDKYHPSIHAEACCDRRKIMWSLRQPRIMSIGGLLACAERSGTVQRSGLRQSGPKKSIDFLTQIPKKKSAHQGLLRSGSRAGAAGATRTTKLAALSSLRISWDQATGRRSRGRYTHSAIWPAPSTQQVAYLGGMLEGCGLWRINCNSTLPQYHAVACCRFTFFRVSLLCSAISFASSFWSLDDLLAPQ